MTTSAISFPGQRSQTPEVRDLVANVRPDLLESHASEPAEDHGLAVANDDSPLVKRTLRDVELAGA